MGHFAEDPGADRKICSAAPDEDDWCARLNSDRTFKVAIQMLKAARYEDAAREFRRALAADPDHFWAWSLLARVLADHLDEPKAAAEAYRRAAGLDPALLMIQSRGKGAAEPPAPAWDAELDGDRQAYLRALDLAPGDPEIWGRYGQFLQEKLFDPDQALEAYDRALALDPEDPWLWAQMGFLKQIDFADLAGAENAFRRALSLDPSYAWAWGQLGEVLACQGGKAAEAYASFRRALALEPDNAWLWSQLARLLADERPLEAQAAYHRVASLRPGDAWSAERLDQIAQSLADAAQEADGPLASFLAKPFTASRRSLRRLSGWWFHRRKASF
jgi:Tfp pilus assembly protein PilF